MTNSLERKIVFRETAIVFRENAKEFRGNAIGTFRENAILRGNAIVFRGNAIFHLILQGLRSFRIVIV